MALMPYATRLDDPSDFRLSDLEITLFCGFWKSDIDFPQMFHSNHMPVSQDIGEFLIRDLQMLPAAVQCQKHSNSNVWPNWVRMKFCCIRLILSLARVITYTKDEKSQCQNTETYQDTVTFFTYTKPNQCTLTLGCPDKFSVQNLGLLCFGTWPQY